MPYSWSNPNQNQGVLSSQGPSSLQFADIGSIVGKIMQMRENQAAQKRQEQADLIKGIGQAAVGAYTGYEKFGEREGQKAMSDYINSYHAQQTDPEGARAGVYEADMNANLEKMNAEQRIKIQEWMINNERQQPRSQFTTDPQTGQRYYSTGKGLHPVPGGEGEPEYTYHEEGGNLYKVDKKGNTVSVPTSESKQYQETRKHLERAKDVSADDLLKEDISTPDKYTFVWKSQSEPITQAHADEAPDKAEVILPSGKRVPYQSRFQVSPTKEDTTTFPSLVKPIQEMQAAKHAAEQLPVKFQSRATTSAGKSFGRGRPGVAAARVQAQSAMSDGLHDPEKVKQIFESTYGETL
jgi:hypothetical protein